MRQQRGEWLDPRESADRKRRVVGGQWKHLERFVERRRLVGKHRILGGHRFLGKHRLLGRIDLVRRDGILGQRELGILRQRELLGKLRLLRRSPNR
jgi:hypothetical protein